MEMMCFRSSLAAGIPMILRDQIVNTIWEGTTNVMSDDVMRVLERSHDSFTYFCEDIQQAIDEVVGEDEMRYVCILWICEFVAL